MTAKQSKHESGLVIEGVTITSPDKILYEESGITKGGVAEYYAKISARMMPYLEKRIISTVRCPGGIDSACFYRKHPANEKGVVSVSIEESGGGTGEYYYVPDVQGILSEVQMNTLEFHTWGCRVDTLEKPDMMVFDFDPDAGMDLARVRQGVRDLKSMLDELSLVSYLKTSGGKGYHVVIPVNPKTGWDDFHDFARNIAETMEAKWPNLYTSNSRKDRRAGRIFIDWLRNGRGATSVAPYSVRARKGAPVSMPIAWEELDTVPPRGVSMDGALANLRFKDPWEDFFKTNQHLK